MLKTYETSGNVLFEEKQNYPQWVKWIVIVGMIITIAGMVIGLITEKEKMEVMIALAIVVPVALLAIYFSSKAQLEKIVTSNGLYYRCTPWHGKYRVIEKDDIESFNTRKLPLLSYGFGWFPTFGSYYNFSRGKGVQVCLKNRKKFFFSTNDLFVFERALQNLISVNLINKV